MIELVDGLPEGSIGARAIGEVTPHDWSLVLAPALRQCLLTHGGVNVLCVLDADFDRFAPGANWDEAILLARTVTGWGRVGLVTDAPWAGDAVALGAMYMSGDLRHFPASELGAARAWVTGTADD